ncbi:RraA family protein [Streptomyces sp. NPDC001663]|uniref:RraA family protein n=1 Tax=Streptomyces sp. NPDC001663 TaxID=3364597 RepID=UPI0036AC31B3
MPATYPQDVIEGFRPITTASVADAVEQVGVRGYLDGAIKPVSPGKIVGPAVTVREVPAEGAGAPVHALKAIDESAPGSVICIAADGADIAVWGGLMTAGAVANQHAGAILDGGVRDVEEINRDFAFPVQARSTVPATTLGRIRTLSLNEPVVLGGLTVEPGDLIVADGDGVVRVPASHVAEVLLLATEIEEREKEQTKLILAAGSLQEGLAKFNRI